MTYDESENIIKEMERHKMNESIMMFQSMEIVINTHRMYGIDGCRNNI